MKKRWQREKGVSLVIVAAGLTAFIGFLALVIDLGMLYAARGDAQKAADAAALAGARYFIDQGTMPASLTSQMKDDSRAMAQAIGGQNKIRGTNIQPSEITVNDADILLLNTANGPVFQVTAQVERNALGTFVANIFGIAAVDIGAVATAQAALPVGSGGGTPPNFNVGTKCLKPWILQNISPRTTDPASPLPFDTNDLGTFVYLHDDQSTNGPSKWGIIAPCPYYDPSNPPCDGGNSSTVYYENIVNCNPNTYYCGQGVKINDVPGNKVGKTQQGTRELIHQGGGNQSEGTGNGQDTITLNGGTGPSWNGYTITGGSNHPNSQLQGQLITENDSDSVVIIPLTNDPPPSNGQLQTNISGFLKVFLTQVHPPNAKPKTAKNQIDAMIIGFVPCQPPGPGGNNGQPQVSANSGGINILRLVR